jgi:hypothetical protein
MQRLDIHAGPVLLVDRSIEPRTATQYVFSAFANWFCADSGCLLQLQHVLEVGLWMEWQQNVHPLRYVIALTTTCFVVALLLQ